MTLRVHSAAEYVKEKKKRKGPFGPYLPTILEACQESELTYEYRHGVESYGAFTYSLSKVLRGSGSISFQKLTDAVAGRLDALGFVQRPQVFGPKSIVQGLVPWQRGAKGKRRQ